MLCAVSSVHAYSREVIIGIHRFQREHPDWMVYRSDVAMLSNPKTFRQMKEREFDAMICFSGTTEDEERAAALSIPTVNVSARSPTSRFPRVLPDHQQVGRMAAAHLLACGLQHFAFVGHQGLHYSMLRFEGFRTEIGSKGLPVEDFQRQEGRKDEEVLAWVREQPEPVGVMTAFDSIARRLADEALFTGIAVPDHLALISADDSDVQSQMGAILLSSVLTRGKQVGWTALQLLDQHLQTEAPLPDTTLIEPQEVVARESTDTVAGVTPKIKEALRYIRRHAAEGIKVGDVLTQVGISRSSLDQKLEACLGHSAHEEIKRQQLLRACTLLQSTSLTVSDIAARCGFSTSSYFRNVFKKKFGQTPIEFRAS